MGLLVEYIVKFLIQMNVANYLPVVANLNCAEMLHEIVCFPFFPRFFLMLHQVLLVTG